MAEGQARHDTSMMRALSASESSTEAEPARVCKPWRFTQPVEPSINMADLDKDDQILVGLNGRLANRDGSDLYWLLILEFGRRRL